MNCVSTSYQVQKYTISVRGQRKRYSDQAIISIVSDALNVSKQDLMSSSRKRELAEARFICFALLKKYAREHWSLVKIGNLFRRDHSTVIYGLECHENLVSRDRNYRRKWETVFNIINPPYYPKP